MIYRELGRTGLKVSQLGFGAMRLPMTGEGDQTRVDDELAVPMIHKAFEAGVNYVDSAVMYCHHDSQRALGAALKGWRDKIVVSTKNHYTGEDEAVWWKNLEDSLRLLDVACIDIYNIHGISAKKLTDAFEPRLLGWMRKAQDQGLFQHLGCSFHDNDDALRAIVDSGHFESITLQYNILDRQLADGMAYAREKGVGVVVMGPVGGGRLGPGNEAFAEVVPHVKRVPELALRFVLSNPDVQVALSGMSTMQQVEENVATCDGQAVLGEEDRALIETHLADLKKMADLYCTGCKYCMPCPQEVNIARVFELYNQGRVYGSWEHARRAYGWLKKSEGKQGHPADLCAECGECVEKCPQDIAIMEQLKQAHAALTV
jgi:hypothetical protein